MAESDHMVADAAGTRSAYAHSRPGEAPSTWEPLSPPARGAWIETSWSTP
jgi:hypothetical protein